MTSSSPSRPGFDDPVAARAALMEPLREEPGPTYFFRLACALENDVAPFDGGVTPQLVGDLLRLNARNSWDRDEDRTRALSRDPYAPLRIFPADGNHVGRTFAVSDLAPSDEGPLRALSHASKNDYVRARLFDVLRVRFGKRDDALEAVKAILQVQRLFGGGERWVEVVRLVVRAVQLVASYPGSREMVEVLAAIEEVAQRILSGTHAFGVIRLAEGLAQSLAGSKQGLHAQLPEEALTRWAVTLEWLAADYHDRGEWMFAGEALAALELWNARRREQSERRRVQRLTVERLLEEARRREPLAAPSVLQGAVARATDWGLSDLVAAARLALLEATRAAAASLKRVAHTVDAPLEFAAQVQDLVAAAGNSTIALMQLAASPAVTCLSVSELAATARKQYDEYVYRRLLPTTHVRKGKIPFQANDEAAKLEEGMAEAAGLHLLLIEYALNNALRMLFDGGMPDDALVRAVAWWPHLSPERVPLLARASERFAQRDFLSSGVMVVTLYEAVLRDLARAVNYAALKVDPDGLTSDETLATVLSRPAVRQVLGADHAWFVEFLLCRPHLGLNLRNEVAHGNFTEHELSPTRVLLVWLFIIRLAALQASHAAAMDAAAATD